MAKNEQLIKILVIIGAIVAIIQALFCFSADVWSGILAPIITIVIGVLLLSAEGVIPLKKKIPLIWWVVLIIGILLWWPLSSMWGGIILIVAALLDKFM